MAIPTTYVTDPAVAFEGQAADPNFDGYIISRAVSTGTIAAGRAVVRGTSDTNVKLPAASGDLATIQGITMYDASKPPGAYGAALWQGSAFLPTMDVVRKGRIWVKVEEAVTQGDPVFVRYASGGGGTNLGAFRKSADTSTAAQIGSTTMQAQYATSASSGGMAIVELNLP